jgi:hypothetical protein
MLVEDIVSHVRGHRCYAHPIFDHWAKTNPAPEVIGALFHHIRCFCDSTRPGLNFPQGLKDRGLDKGCELLQEIVKSEEDHGPQLAAMAGHIINLAAKRETFPNVYDQVAVESGLKACSDKILGSLPGYDHQTGLMPQTKSAIAVFHRRRRTDEESIYCNLGTTLALEIISNRHLIPQEKHCLVDSCLYGASLDQPEMHYLLEHYGETGAEAHHEQNAIDAIASVIDESHKPLVHAGADAFLNNLVSLWDLLDSALLGSGQTDDLAAKSGATASQ